MNERIRELAEQAGFETDRGPLIVPGPYIKVGGLCVGVPLEKFAELIVQRTLDIVEAHTEIFQSSEARAMVEHIKNSVKTDFGVEDV